MRKVVGDRVEGAHGRRAAQRVDVVEDEGERRLAVLADGIVHRARDARQQPPGVVVALVEGDPGERPPVALGPLAQERRLAEAGRCDDGDQGRAVRVTQGPHEPGAPHGGVEHRLVRARQGVEVPVRACPVLPLDDRDGDHGAKHRLARAQPARAHATASGGAITNVPEGADRERARTEAVDGFTRL